MWIKTPESEANKLEQQFLIHSYLYYVKNESLIDDSKYDLICKNLIEMMQFVKPRYEVTKGLDSSGSGYYIKKYPDKIISKAELLLKWSVENK